MNVNLLINKTLTDLGVIDTITLPNKREDDKTVSQEDTMLYLKIADALNVTYDIICDFQTNEELLTSYVVNTKITFTYSLFYISMFYKNHKLKILLTSILLISSHKSYRIFIYKISNL
jgi:hypothetical protein